MRGSCPGDTRALFAVIEAGEHRALGHSIPHIRLKVDEDAGYLEPDLGCHTRLDRSEAENLDCYVGLGVRTFTLIGRRNRAHALAPAAATTARMKANKSRCLCFVEGFLARAMPRVFVSRTTGGTSFISGFCVSSISIPLVGSG